MTQKFNSLLQLLVQNKGTDLHINSGSEVFMRVKNLLRRLSGESVSREEIETIIKQILTPDQIETLRADKRIDTPYTSLGRRFHVHIYSHYEGYGMDVRLLPEDVPSFAELRLPNFIKEVSSINSGLVLITGANNSGKTTTLAAILDYINSTSRKNIIQIERAIDYVHPSKLSLVSQRIIGHNSLSVSHALDAVFREDADIVFLDEFQSAEEIEKALQLAASTDTVVYATMLAFDARDAVGRIISMFSECDQEHIRLQLSLALEAIISIRLVPDKKGKKVPAVEFLKKTARISDMIAERREREILDAIEQGQKTYGTQSFDQALTELYRQGIIDDGTAVRYATNHSDTRLALDGIRILN